MARQFSGYLAKSPSAHTGQSGDITPSCTPHCKLTCKLRIPASNQTQTIYIYGLLEPKALYIEISKLAQLLLIKDMLGTLNMFSVLKAGETLERDPLILRFLPPFMIPPFSKKSHYCHICALSPPHCVSIQMMLPQTARFVFGPADFSAPQPPQS
jgi:hypothetical protein